MIQPSDDLCALPDTGFIRVAGANATSFLHAQLAIDVDRLPGNGARLAAWLTAQGRVTGLFSLARRGDDEWLLACHASLVAPLAQRLKLYVLRSAVHIEDVTHQWHALTLIPEEGSAGNAGSLGGDPDSWRKRGGALFRRPFPGVTEVWASAPAFKLPQRDPERERAACDHWRRQRVAAGVPELTAGNRDQYTAHMLNLDLLGAVSFDKGCYPGQEVVARTRNLGRTPRRTLLFHTSPNAVDEGTSVVGPSGATRGAILNAVTGQPTFVLAVVTLAAIHEPLFVGAPGGAELTLAAQPYPIPELSL